MQLSIVAITDQIPLDRRTSLLLLSWLPGLAHDGLSFTVIILSGCLALLIQHPGLKGFEEVVVHLPEGDSGLNRF